MRSLTTRFTADSAKPVEIRAGILSIPSIPARLSHIAEADDLLRAGQSDAT
jgi:hypothetical protein